EKERAAEEQEAEEREGAAGKEGRHGTQDARGHARDVEARRREPFRGAALPPREHVDEEGGTEGHPERVESDRVHGPEPERDGAVEPALERRRSARRGGWAHRGLGRAEGFDGGAPPSSSAGTLRWPG